jgi:hypothetical protein
MECFLKAAEENNGDLSALETLTDMDMALKKITKPWCVSPRVPVNIILV